ncbi:MAG: GAF domain-containing protein, partial [Polyangiaceae bacterium]
MAQAKALVSALRALRDGDFSVRLPTKKSAGKRDPMSAVASVFNQLARKNEEQDWLKTNVARFQTLMQPQKTIEDLSRVIMSELTPLVAAHHGAFFINANDGGETVFKLIASYAYKARKTLASRFALGEGLVGQSALEKKSILLTQVPEDYIRITSGLGEATPLNVIVAPVIFEGEVRAVIELASFRVFTPIEQSFLDEISTGIGVILTMIVLEGQAASLKASEELLRDQQEELQQINEELEEKAALLSEQNKKVEQKNREVEMARHAIEEKAEQLSLSSKYKSEFLANMSHELRTPL